MWNRKNQQYVLRRRRGEKGKEKEGINERKTGKHGEKEQTVGNPFSPHFPCFVMLMRR